MGNRYIKDALEKRIYRLGYDDIGGFVDQAVEEALRRLEGGKEEKKWK